LKSRFHPALAERALGAVMALTIGARFLGQSKHREIRTYDRSMLP
jgi:hypothetical protein